MSAAEEDAAAAAADGGSGGGSSGAGSSEGGARRRFDHKGLVARTSLILWHTHQNDVGAVRKLLEEDAALVNARDYDSRTPLHVAALHGWHDVAECLIANGADVNSQDRWQNTPLADAEGAKRQSMIELLKEHGGLTYVCIPIPPVTVWYGFSGGKTGSHFEPKTIPPPLTNKADWEINPLELDFTKAQVIGKGSFGEILKANWRGTPIAVKRILPSLSDDRLVIGMAYLHNEPNVVIHRDLKPRNILLVNSAANHLKVGDFGLSKIIKAQHVNDVYKMTGETGSYRYMAPEVFKHRKYDKKVDIFSFAMILYEIILYDRRCWKVIHPSPTTEPYEAANLVELCWSGDISLRPSFLEILKRLEKLKEHYSHENHWHLFQ
ncbi:unnamed protein product [Miscanthus lutarioriparius]|uniref:Protein kinase domain-containing protein n=1 Tax=Miscanthus lutarioriparius TaxID=422564 RepID=A0A811SIQ3_9POAL|nr:unnamed protein product [Miscanthus lutarioriparius]